MNPNSQSLSPQQVAEFLRQVALTREQEVDCGTCIENIGEYAETKLTGRDLDEALQSIEQHLGLCPECAEEYEALKKILETASRESTR